MKWEKQGLIFQPDKRLPWMQSHCQLPLAFHLENDRYRIYFASRNKNQYSHIGSIDIDINHPHQPLSISKDPILSPGDIGFFDEHGVYPSSIIRKDGKLYLYYIGWNKGCEPPLFYASIGLAISDDGGQSFKKISKAPILSRSEHDPCLVTAPTVFSCDDHWGMIYTSGIKWERDEKGNLHSHYHLKSARSHNGIDWKREGKIVIDFKDSSETNISRSTLLFDQGCYRLWFAYATQTTPYRLGYAESKNLNHWVRKDETVGIDVSKEGVDSEMLCYPSVIKHNGCYHMFYNGNQLGRDGIAYATLRECSR